MPTDDRAVAVVEEPSRWWWWASRTHHVGNVQVSASYHPLSVGLGVTASAYAWRGSIPDHAIIEVYLLWLRVEVRFVVGRNDAD